MPLLRSWLDSANDPDGPFPLNNLPCGVFLDDDGLPRCGVAIGDSLLDVAALDRLRILDLKTPSLLQFGDWSRLMAEGPTAWRALRARLVELLAEGSPEHAKAEPHLRPLSGVRLVMPFRVAGYTDFYASRHHAENMGAMLRGVASLPPNWLHLPLGYNGRASSVVVSGTKVRRPWGQLKPPGAEAPIFAPSSRFDIELELGAVVGVPWDRVEPEDRFDWTRERDAAKIAYRGNVGRPLTVAESDDAIFGYVLLNDWSARDIQAWEYQPLGPFQAKATATTISPWIVMAEALRPFRVPTPPREEPLLPYLREPGPLGHDIDLEVEVTPAGGRPTVISRTNARELAYSAAQQLAHHSSSGCPMEVGDLLGSGTISGPTPGSRGSLMELSWNGQEPIPIGGGTRTFLEDGDTVTLRGHAQGDGYRIGFGDCTGQVLPALADPYAR